MAKPLNQSIYCATMTAIMTLVFPSYTTDQVMTDLWLVSFKPLPFHDLQP